MEFQLITALTRIKQYQNIHQEKTTLFERSIRESLEVFYPCVKFYYQHPKIRNFVENSYKFFCNNEPHFDEEIFLQTPLEIIIKRISQRNRDGETCTKSYLKQLEKQYRKFYNQEKNNYYKCLSKSQLIDLLDEIFEKEQLREKDKQFINYYKLIMSLIQ